MIHVFGFGESTPSDAFHEASVNCDAPEAKAARVLYHRDPIVDLSGNGFCRYCALTYPGRGHDASVFQASN